MLELLLICYLDHADLIQYSVLQFDVHGDKEVIFKHFTKAISKLENLST